MCGRYGLYDDSAKIRQYFGASNELAFDRRFNVAPSQLVPVVSLDESGDRVLSPRDGASSKSQISRKSNQ